MNVGVLFILSVNVKLLCAIKNGSDCTIWLIMRAAMKISTFDPGPYIALFQIVTKQDHH